MINRTYRHLSWAQVESACLFIYNNMIRDGYAPNAIIALLRGGVIPGRIFSDFFDILLDFFALDVKMYDGIGIKKEEAEIKAFYGDVHDKKILIVDDIWDSGKTMQAVLQKLGHEEVTTATLFWKETAEQKPNYYAEISKENEWVIFPWESNEFKRLTKF